MLLAARAAPACSCIDLAGVADPGMLGRMAGGAEVIVHARVVAAPSAGTARIEAIEWLKGGPVELLRGRPGASSSCGLEFRLGEEAVFLVYNGEVSLCGRQRATPELLERLRRLKTGK